MWKCYSANYDGENCPEGFAGPFLVVDTCLGSQLVAGMTQKDPDIHILHDHAEELHSSLLRGKTT
ncbi:hypothetical protein DPMN_055411 [Dreissena polymorpha]|uniref:Uncharacterized protein n=1 Tax=Dreissena polymorpha TaxID=45954 RepID=A0A9D4CSK3_DREPO|nr:hypothetical protein DPMN_055411 [Dreissena polymorpha]